MTSPRVLDGLKALAESLPAETPVPVPAGLLRELLGYEQPQGASASVPPDATVGEIARRFGRSASTVRGWLDRGLIPGAYRFQGREWRIPAVALTAFEERQRPNDHPPTITPPRGRSARPVDLSAWRSAS
ncbi:MAG: helix-turn-helix domain-containing protein [Gemmatimonadales bacterium]